MSMTKEEMQQELEKAQELLRKQQEEMDALKAEAEAARAAVVMPVPASVADVPKKDPNKPVTIKLFKDGQRYSEALYVNVNNRNFIIPRGVAVTVPYFVAKAIEESAAQDENTAALIAKYEDEYMKAKEFLS